MTDSTHAGHACTESVFELPRPVFGRVKLDDLPAEKFREIVLQPTRLGYPELTPLAHQSCSAQGAVIIAGKDA